MNCVGLLRTRVVIVDDSRTTQALLEHLLLTRLTCDVVGIAGDGQSAIAMIERLRPDLVTIDLSMPYIDGQQLLKALEPYPAMRKVVVSGSVTNDAMKSSLKQMGADGCICKTDMSRDPDGFCQALATIMRSAKRARAWPPASPVVRPPAKAAYPIPVDERERLVALAALDVANDDADDRLDRLTEQLAKTTGFCACIMTFIDHDTQWIKSAYGLDRGSTPRSQAICNHTICDNAPFVIHDTFADHRFASFELVLSGPKIRSYVGHPIVASTGVRLGAICLLDTSPRQATLKELTDLRSIARSAAALIESRVPPLGRAA